MDNRERYRQLCEQEGDSIPIFLQYWWWQTVANGKPWEVLFAHRDGQVVGAMPLLATKKWGIPYSLIPQLTMFNGPWLRNPADADAATQIATQLRQRRLLLHVVRLQPGTTANDAVSLALQQVGYQASEHGTYRFKKLQKIDVHMQNASKLRRRDYHQLSASLTVDYALSPLEFADLHSAHFSATKQGDLLPKHLIVQVVCQAVARHHGLAVGARDAEGRLQAAVFVAYDSHCAYLLMLARSSTAPRNATAFVVWKAIEWLYGKTQAFDFEGGADPGVAKFYRSFGSVYTPLPQLTKARLPLVKRLL